MDIKVKPEFVDLFVKSNAVRTMKEKSHFLTKIPKVNKDHQKIVDLKEKIKENDSKERALNKKIWGLRFKV